MRTSLTQYSLAYHVQGARDSHGAYNHNSKYKVRVLVNSGIEANYIKRRLVLDIDILLILKVTSLTLLEKRRI